MTSVRHVSEPVGYLEDLIHGFREGARDPAGMHLDAELCRGLAEGLGDVLDGLELFIALAEQVRAAAAPTPKRRTAVERQILASMAQALDPDGCVIAFPLFSGTGAHVDGGSAA
jgi:hypothetical protein